MKHEIFNLTDIEYTGFKIEVNLDNIEESDFETLWNRVFSLTTNNELEPEEFYIGLEDYSSYTNDNKYFSYYAMCPSRCVSGKIDDHINKTLSAGKYIKFENTFKNHGPAFFRKVYNFVKKNNIPVEEGFDFEIINKNFDRNNGDSIIYVGLKIKE